MKQMGASKNQYPVIILGAGISGLAAAWYLYKKYPDQKILILEKEERAGGWIKTEKMGDFLFECGPRGCQPKDSGLCTLELIQDLGLSDKLITADSAAKKRFLYVDGKFIATPTHPIQAFFKPLFRHALYQFWQERKVNPSNLEDESIADFISRRLSKKVLSDLISPLVSGIYAGDTNELSIRSCFPKLFAAEKKYGSLWAAFFAKKNAGSKKSYPIKTPLFSLEQGMESLIHALIEKNTALSLHLNEEVISVEQSTEGVTITTNKRKYTTQTILSAIPASQMGAVLKTESLQIVDTLKQIPAISIAVVNLAYDREVLPIRGFGYLCPPRCREPILGVVFDSHIFPTQGDPNKTRLTVMLPVQPGKKANPNRILQTAKNTLEKHLSISLEPLYERVFIANNAIPQYIVGHSKKLEELDSFFSSKERIVYLLGSSYFGVSVNDCIKNARAVISKLR